MSADPKVCLESVRRAVRNRWPQTLADIGIDHLYLRNRHGPCPGCGGTDRFRFDDQDGRGTFVCSQGGEILAGDGFALVMHVDNCSFSNAVDRVAGVLGIAREDAKTFERIEVRPAKIQAQVSKRSTLSDSGQALWNQCVALSGVGLAYLNARACVIPPPDGDLRYHPDLRHPSGYAGPALVALITHAEYGHPMTLHQTWIQADGSKAALEKPRLLLPGHVVKDGVIRLWPDEAVTHGLGLAEGIETALSLAHGFRPVWCAVAAGNLAEFPALPGIESLLIAADHDDAGLNAAQRCSRTWIAAGREVRVIVPPAHKSDLNDLARAA